MLGLITLLSSGCVTQSTYVGSGEKVVQTELDKIEAAKTRIALALNYLEKGNAGQAKYNLDKAEKFAPKLAEVHYSLAYYYQIVKEFDRAAARYEKVLEIDPNNGDAMNNYGAFLCQIGRYDEAERYFLKAVEQEAYLRSAETYENLGVCASESGKQARAERYLTRSLEHNPYKSSALYEMTKLQLANDQYDEAQDYLQRYLKSGRLSAKGLWLAYQVEFESTNATNATRYGRMLLQRFPQTIEAQNYKDTLR